MPRLVLHAGDGKCGSTAIQASLYDAREALAEQGILYHAPRRIGGHFVYSRLIGLTVRGDAERAHTLARDNLAEVVEKAKAPGVRFVVLSAEFILCSTKPKSLQTLLAPLLSEIDGIDIVAYIRPPDKSYLAHSLQRAKASHTIEEPATYVRDFASPLVAWPGAPLQARVHARLYRREEFADNSVVADLAGLLSEITGTEVTLPEVVANPSLTTEQTLAMARLRRDVLPERNGLLLPISNNLVRFFEEANAACGALGRKAQLRPEAAAQVLNANWAHVALLEKKRPDLGFGRAFGLPEHPPETDMAQRFGTFEGILEPGDAALVDSLATLVPALNPALTKGEIDSAVLPKVPPGTRRGLLRAWIRYLRREGLEATVEAVRERYLSPAPSPARPSASPVASSDAPSAQ